ncbi:hypothetical protein JDV02_008103 [Purpureocillium takamizusanense]|uniref:Adhesin domain-containing protein n=1 Tax=Purpureocillium takamizusanense TaxID=2060973 RepID=A0A9Q8QPJ8_9HYPO|nr:uncharacterized protein JDV02_008103 [Purpureocillium takamizusanense]UNI22192.1 hypothetical protein JDV02_008103 [Purpureocillium takamizusanense]
MADEDDLYARTEDGAAASPYDDSVDDEDLVLSPANGYFGALLSRGDDSPPAERGRTSANVPIIPNIMVVDPTLRPSAAAEAKAREATESSSGRPGSERPSQPISDASPGRGASDSQQSHAQAEPPPPSPSVVRRGSEQHTPNTHNVPQHTSHSRDSSLSLRVPTPRTRPVHRHGGHDHRMPPYLDAPPAYSPRPGISYGAIAHDSAAAPSPPSRAAITPTSEQQPLLLTPPHSLTSQFPEVASPSLFRMHFDWTAGGKALRKRAVLVLVALVILVIAATILIGLLLGSLPQNHEYIEEPVKVPEDSHGDMVWKPLPSCRQKSNSRLAVGQSFHFAAQRNLTILQLTEQRHGIAAAAGRAIQVFGELAIRPATGSFFPSGYFAVESMANHDSLGFTFSLDENGSLKVATPGTIHNWDDDDDAQPCIQLRIILYVPRETVLRALDIQTQDLDVSIEKGTIMSVAEDAQILTFAGDITAPVGSKNQSFAPYRLEATSIVAQSLSGRVSGWFPLYEELALITRFGDITATIGQKLPRHRPSTFSFLTVTSLHGKVSVQELGQSPSVDARPRDRRVEIETETGDIWAETLHSATVQVKSVEGSLNLTLTPAFDADCVKWGYESCRIMTETKLGATHAVVNSPSRPQADAIRDPAVEEYGETIDDTRTYSTHANTSNLYSTHGSSSGDLFATYPSEWQGNILASTFTGHMNYTGDGLVMKPWDAINKRMKGTKGDGKSRMIVVSRDGNQRVAFGGGPVY